MILDIYTDARSENIPKKILLKNPSIKQIEMQIASIAVDEDENEYQFVEKTTVIEVKNQWKEFSDIEFKSSSSIAEMYSIYSALLWSIWIDQPIKRINLYTDSEQSFKFINQISRISNGDIGFKPLLPKCPLIKKINDEIKSLIIELKKSDIIVDIRWIKGHDACYHNRKVDKLCKL
jgi:ribonuclease HI